MSNNLDLTIEQLKKFCLEQKKDDDKEKTDNSDKSLKTFSNSHLQFGNLLTCDLVLEHHGRKYFSHKSAISSILDMNALGFDALVTAYQRSFHPDLERTVEFFTINEDISLYHLSELLFYGYYRRFPFENYNDNRVAEFMVEIVTAHSITVSNDAEQESLKTSNDKIYDQYLKDIFVIPRKEVPTEEYKQRLIELLHVAIKFKAVLIIDDILDFEDLRINWFEMYTPFAKINSGGALGKVKEKVIGNIAKNFEEIINDSSTDYVKHISEFNFEDLSSLLRRDNLRVSEEIQVWKIFLIWARAHPNQTEEIEHFVCYNLRYALLLPAELKNIFSALYNLLPREIYQNIHSNFSRNYEQINELLCQGKIVSYKNRVLGEAHHATKLRKFTEVVLIFGGWMVGTQANFVECFAPSLDLIMDIMEFPMFDMGAYFGCEYLNGQLFIFGGSSKDNLNSHCLAMSFHENIAAPKKYKWRKLKDMSTPRCYVGSCVYRGSLVAVGGYDGRERLSSVETYDVARNTWSPMANMLHARSDSCAVVLNDRIYVAGGINVTRIEQSMEYYDPIKKKWLAAADMLISRTSFAMVVFRGRIWALGGNSGSRRTASCDSYDPVSNTWMIEASMNEPRSTFKAIVARDNIYIFGGYNGGGPISTVEKYCPETNMWTVENNLHFDRSGHAVVGLPFSAASKFEIPLVDWTNAREQ